MKLVIGHLYPRLMNMYADRGNVICLEQRCRWRGIEVEIRSIDPGPMHGAAELDILLVGGGQDREQMASLAGPGRGKGLSVAGCDNGWAGCARGVRGISAIRRVLS